MSYSYDIEATRLIDSTTERMRVRYYRVFIQTKHKCVVLVPAIQENLPLNMRSKRLIFQLYELFDYLTIYFILHILSWLSKYSYIYIPLLFFVLFDFFVYSTHLSFFFFFVV